MNNLFLAVIEMCGDCKDVISSGVPRQVVNIIHLVYNAVRIAVPLILILVGMFDMGRAITLQKEDEIKKAQQLLARKAVAAALVFVIVSAVGMIFSMVDNESDSANTWSCINAMLSGECSSIEKYGS